MIDPERHSIRGGGQQDHRSNNNLLSPSFCSSPEEPSCKVDNTNIVVMDWTPVVSGLGNETDLSLLSTHWDVLGEEPG